MFFKRFRTDGVVVCMAVCMLLLGGCGGGRNGFDSAGRDNLTDGQVLPETEPTLTGGAPPLTENAPLPKIKPPPPPANEPPVGITSCSNTPQRAALRGFLKASDSDNSANELTFSLDPTLPQEMGPIKTKKGSIKLLDVTTGAFRYIPNKRGPRGKDSFAFRVDDPESFSVATETIIVNPAIMPLGDSITAGVFKRNQPGPEEQVGYRRKLYDQLIAGGFEVDLVGSSSAGEAANPPIGDPQHEGHPGFTAAEIANHTRSWLNLNPADIVLLHAGTNNINIDDPKMSAMDTEDILNAINRWERANATSVTVFLATIIERSNQDGSFPNPQVDAYNRALLKMVANRPKDDIVIVDQHSALSYPHDMTPQKGQFIHPDQGGYDKMAVKWRERIVASGKLPTCKAK